MKNIFLILLLSSFPSIYSQKLHGRFIDKNLHGKTVYLYDVFQGDGQPIDETRINSYGKFAFKNTKYDFGFYRINAEQQPGITIILNPNEKEVEVEIDTLRSRKRVNIIKSRENTIFRKYFFRMMNVYNNLEELLFAMSFPVNDDIISRKENEMLFSDLTEDINRSLFSIQSKYSDTYMYDLLLDLQPNYNAIYEKRIEEYFSSGTMMGTKFLRSPLNFNKINTYLRFYAGENGVDMHIAIDELLMHTYDNYEVYGYCLGEILLFLDRHGEKELMEYVADEYLGDEMDMISKPSLRKKIEGIYALKIGTYAPDLNIPHESGRDVNLHELYNKNKLNLVFFWASWCPHCMNIIPEIRSIYEDYRSAGLEVIAISVDKKENEWKDAITSENLSWTNVSNLAGWDSESTDVYYVSSTPTFFLVDNNRTIVGKPDGYNEVARLLDNLLR